MRLLEDLNGSSDLGMQAISIGYLIDLLALYPEDHAARVQSGSRQAGVNPAQ